MAGVVPREQQRDCHVLAGDVAWAHRQISRCLTQAGDCRVLWIGGKGAAGVAATPAARVRSCLGSEYDLLVFDAHSGFHPDAFAAALGTLRGGGQLWLMLPPLDTLGDFADPDKQRLAHDPLSLGQVTNRLLLRLLDRLHGDPCVRLFTQGADVSLPAPPICPESGVVHLTDDQCTAVEAVRRVARGHARRPLVMISDRGRGKSTVLGSAAADLLQGGLKRIRVTAPQRASVDTLFTRLSSCLDDARSVDGGLLWRDGVVEFVLPDACAALTAPCDLLLVDEAAAIPASVLLRLLQRNNRVVFATTVHGYEGTGRGFEIRFRNHLQQLAPQWRELRLRQPVRWAEGDPLEALLTDLLLLDADVADYPATAGNLDDLRCLSVHQQQLADDELQLREVFGLLLAAHYQTRPSDLRQLLDGPDLRIVVARCDGRIVGVLLAVAEGGFSAEMAAAIWAGERRPRGHLLAQSLATHGGYQEVARMKLLRVMRIAVHPQWRRRGTGRALLSHLEQEAGVAGLDALGTSFGLSDELLPFWRNSGFRPVRLGRRRDPSSGTHSLQMLAPLNSRTDGFCSMAEQRFQQALPWDLVLLLADLEPQLALELLQARDCSDLPLSERDMQDLRAIALHHRDPDTSLFPLWKWTCSILAGTSLLADADRVLLIRLVLQRHAVGDVARDLGLPGRRGVMKQLRQVIRQALFDS